MQFILSIYQAMSSAISLFVHPIAFWRVGLQAGEPAIFLFISVIIFLYVGYIGYINLMFVLKGKRTKNFLVVNQSFNMLQILHVSIFGMVYYFIAGPEVTPA